jgi:hypothetical protein
VSACQACAESLLDAIVHPQQETVHGTASGVSKHTPTTLSSRQKAHERLSAARSHAGLGEVVVEPSAHPPDSSSSDDEACEEAPLAAPAELPPRAGAGTTPSFDPELLRGPQTVERLALGLVALDASVASIRSGRVVRHETPHMTRVFELTRSWFYCRRMGRNLTASRT